MRFTELVRESLRALGAHKLRSFLTTLGVVIAVWIIVSVVSVISGMDHFVGSKVFSLSPDVYVVTRFGIITSFEEFLEAVKRKPISNEEARRLAELCESCAEVGRWLDGRRPVHVGALRMADVSINGTSANIASLQNVDIEAGRYFTELEDLNRAPVAVIGAAVREGVFPRLDPIGRTVWLGGRPHRVIGLIAKQGTVLGENRDVVVFIPYRSAERLFGRQRDFGSETALFVRARGGVADVAGSQQEVIQIFRWLRHTPFRSRDPVAVVAAEQVAALWRQISAVARFVVLFISGISLFVGAIVVANIMLVSVVERTREIGVRMAMGARGRDVRRQFLIEACALALLGGIVGTLLGMATAWIVNTQSPFPARIEPGTVVLALAVACGSGVVAGFFPARKAASLPPVEALRHE